MGFGTDLGNIFVILDYFITRSADLSLKSQNVRCGADLVTQKYLIILNSIKPVQTT